MDTNIGYWEKVLEAPTPAYQELFSAEREYLIRKIPYDAKVLDIGFGEGRNIKSILNKTRFVTGIDNDARAVADAAKNFSEIETVKIVRGEAADIPFENGSFDVVTLLMILPNLDSQKEKSFCEAARVLKNGGKLIMSTFAETAFEERMKIYKKVGAPIEKVEGTKITFDKSLGANTSEQFSLDQISELAGLAGFKLVDSRKVGELAYLCTLEK